MRASSTKTNLYASHAAEQLPCSARAIVYCPLAAGALTGLQVKRFATNQPLKKEIPFDLATLTLIRLKRSSSVFAVPLPGATSRACAGDGPETDHELTARMASTAVRRSLWIGKDGNDSFFAARRAVLADVLPLWIGMLILTQCLVVDPQWGQTGPRSAEGKIVSVG